MPDLLQRALSALWRLFMTLWMFADGYMISAAQLDPVSTFVTPCSWFLYLYILFFPTSSIAARFVPVFDLLDDKLIIVLVSVLAVVLLFRSLSQRSPLGVLCVLALPILEFCRIRHVVYRAATIAGICKLPEPPQAGAAAVEAEGSEHTPADAVHEARIAAEQEKPTEPEQLDTADPAGGPPEGGAPESRALGVMKILWSVLRLVVAIGALTVVAHFLIDAQLKSWVVNTAPINSTPVFEAEVIIQANQTELPIPVPPAEFIPTATFGSPCHAAPTPTPIAKSTQAWIGTAMSTPMPTPMPAPTPNATPQPEPVPVPIKPNDALNRLFDFDLSDPTPVLKWYFSLPTASQYSVIVISLMVLWCFSKPLIILAANIVVLAIAYFVSAAVIALLLLYGFTDEQSIAIALPADCALIVSIWWAYFWLNNLANACSRNAADHMQLSGRFEQSRTKISQWMGNKDESIDVLIWRVDKCKEWVERLLDKLHAQAKVIKKHQSIIKCLVTRKAHKADLDRMNTTIRALSDRLDGFEYSEGDADTLGISQEELSNLNVCLEELRAGKADAADLEQVRRELKELIGRVNNLDTTRVDSKNFESLSEQLKALVGSFDEVRNATLQHGASISRLDKETETSEKAINTFKNQVASDKMENADMVSNLEQEITKVKKENADVKQENDDLRQDVRMLRNDMDDIKKSMQAMQASQVTQDDLQGLREDVTSDADLKVKTLRSDTNSQLEQATQDHKNLEGMVNKHFSDSSKAVENLRGEHDDLSGKQEKLRKDVEERIDVAQNTANGVRDHVNNYEGGMDLRFDEFSAKINAAISEASSAVQLVQAVESRLNGSIADLQDDDKFRSKVEKYIGDYLVSPQFRAAVEDAQLTLKKQSKRDRLRAQVHDAAKELLGRKEIQEKIYANFKERQALNSPPSDPPGVVTGGRASSPSFGASTSPAASGNTTGNDDPLGDSPGVINGGRATLPGDMSSDDTTNPIIPEESTIPDDVDDHHDTRSGPPGETPGVNPGGRATNLAGSTSDGASGDEPRPSDEDDDDTPEPEQREGKDARESDNLADEQLHYSAIREQPGGEQDEQTDEEKTDDEADDDADDDSDDDDSDDDDPWGPPPGSGGFHGRDGTGDGDHDDYEDGDNGGARRPFTGIGASRSAPGLASSRYAADPTLGSNDSEVQSHAHGRDFEPQDDHDNGTKHQSQGDSKHCSPGQQWRKAKHQVTNGIKSVRQAMNEAVMERQQQRKQNMPIQEQHHPTEARTRLSTARKSLKDSLRHLEKTQNLLQQAHDHQAEQAHDQPESELPKPDEADGLRQEGHNLAEESRILQDALQGRGQSTRNQNESGQGKARRGGRGGKKKKAQEDQTASQNIEEAQGSLGGWE